MKRPYLTACFVGLFLGASYVALVCAYFLPL